MSYFSYRPLHLPQLPTKDEKVFPAGDAASARQGEADQDMPHRSASASSPARLELVPALPAAVEARESRVCPVCGEVKAVGHYFCKTDFLALPLGDRLDLTKPRMRSEAAQRDAAFDRALQFLRGLPQRATRYVEGNGVSTAWRYHSAEELEAAGYRQIDYAQCPSPKCAAKITWWWTPNQKRMALNFPSYTPHAASCKDPEYSARVKAAKKERRAQRRRKKGNGK